MNNCHPSQPVVSGITKNNQEHASRQQGVIHHPRPWSGRGKEFFMRVSVDANDIEWLLNEVSGVLATLYQQEADGIEVTSIRIEINAIEAMRSRLGKMTQQAQAHRGVKIFKR